MCKRKLIIRTQFVVNREMNFYTVVSKKARKVIVKIIETYNVRATKLIILPIINNLLFVYWVSEII